MAQSFGHFFEIEEANPPKSIAEPGRARRKSSCIRSPTDQELDCLAFGERLDGPHSTRSGYQTPKTTTSQSYTGVQTPITPNELEASHPPTPSHTDATPLAATFWNPPMNKWRVLCACAVYFSNGLNDSAPGALIPFIEKSYGISYAVVSLIFVTNAAGFIAAAFFNDAMVTRLGRASTLALSEAIMAIGCIIVVCTPPWPAVVAAFFPLGFGCAVNLALNNVFCANLYGSTIILGFAHGSYGIGGTIGPIAATAMASHGIVWSRFYFVPLGARILCLLFNVWAFWNYDKEAAPPLLAELERLGNERGATSDAEEVKQRNPKVELFKEAVRNRTTLIGALFIFAYQGAEVAIAGWVTSFLIKYRGGEAGQVGYATAGFFGGITLGRFALAPLAHRWGEHGSVYFFAVGGIILQVLVWTIPNLVTNTIMVALLGLILGPIYPCVQTIFSRLLPRKIQVPAVGFIASAGSSGGAVAPFFTGLIAQAKGTWVLHPICVSFFASMMVCWWALPSVRKRTE
ncbi:major facilitator superfamily domain-containing protein [Phyllosticta capitalensis]|uniref:major facilitator superfamily domain-containing protein n=1 Tax=Phyllosticta capitalensis TaxID=121624 RepID=UPI0031303D15